MKLYGAIDAILMSGRHVLDALSTVHNHLRAVDKRALITSKVKTHIGDIIRLRKTAKRDVPEELRPVFRRVFHSSKH